MCTQVLAATELTSFILHNVVCALFCFFFRLFIGRIPHTTYEFTSILSWFPSIYTVLWLHCTAQKKLFQVSCWFCCCCCLKQIFCSLFYIFSDRLICRFTFFVCKHAKQFRWRVYLLDTCRYIHWSKLWNS